MPKRKQVDLELDELEEKRRELEERMKLIRQNREEHTDEESLSVDDVEDESELEDQDENSIPHDNEENLSNSIKEAELETEAQVEIPLSNSLEAILGDDPNVSKALKLNIHSKITSRLHYYMTNGMKKEDIDVILKKYEVPESLAAPILNEQIESKLNEKAIKRDGYRLETQRLASTAMTAIAAAITTLNSATEEEGIDQDSFLEKLSETAKLLAEISFQQSETRKAYIVPRFTKSFQEVLKKCKPEKFLFGKDLSTKIKDIKDTDRLFKDLTSERNVPKPINKSQGNARRPLAKKNPASRRAGTGPQGQAKPKYFFKKFDQRGQPRYNQGQGQQFQKPKNQQEIDN